MSQNTWLKGSNEETVGSSVNCFLTQCLFSYWCGHQSQMCSVLPIQYCHTFSGLMINKHSHLTVLSLDCFSTEILENILTNPLYVLLLQNKL